MKCPGPVASTEAQGWIFNLLGSLHIDCKVFSVYLGESTHRFHLIFKGITFVLKFHTTCLTRYFLAPKLLRLCILIRVFVLHTGPEASFIENNKEGPGHEWQSQDLHGSPEWFTDQFSTDFNKYVIQVRTLTIISNVFRVPTMPRVLVQPSTHGTHGSNSTSICWMKL